MRRPLVLLFLLMALPGCARTGPGGGAVDGSGPSVTNVQPKTLTTKGGDMVLIPAGTFEMGSMHGKDESPIHSVTVDAFWMDRCEVKQSEFDRLSLPNPSHFKGPDLPAEQVTWAQAAYFCNVRSRDEGLAPCYDEATGACNFEANGYRLPTEAEWEYACRAGSTSDYGAGHDSRKLDAFAWHTGNSGAKTHPVGKKQPNAWGLHDMHGNVAEWCNDVYAKDGYSSASATNPHGPADGKEYVLRGGAWNSNPAALRSSARVGENPGFSDACLARDAIGFRCVRRVVSRDAQRSTESTRSADDTKRSVLPTAFVYDERYLEHKTGKDFVERPERVEAIAGRMKRTGLLDKVLNLKPEPAPIECVTAVHSKEYVERVRRACDKCGDGIRHLDTRDVPICARSYDIALLSAGGPLAAIDAIMAGTARNAFCAIRPPGHHDQPEMAMGFCIFNNVAIAARYIQKKHKLAKVLIVDWDVHHGNGTQDIFYEDPSIMYFSTHQSPFYPNTGKEDEQGKGKAVGNTINVPLAANAGDKEVKKAYEEKLKPAALAFKPDFILISCGFDSHRGDTLGGLAITTEGFGDMTRIVKEIASKCCQGRIVSMLEGGYYLENLASASEKHVRVLMEE